MSRMVFFKRNEFFLVSIVLFVLVIGSALFLSDSDQRFARITGMPVMDEGSDYKILYFHNDHLGSPVATTNQNGDVVWSADYEPFGQPFNEVAEDGQNKRKYNDKELDADTGLYYYGARYYDADIGRFTTADIVPGSPTDPQSLNRYVYVKNNPMKFIDPSGTSDEFTHTRFAAPAMKMVSSLFYKLRPNDPAIRNMYLYVHGSQTEPLDVSSEFTKSGTSTLSAGGFRKITMAIAGEYARKAGGDTEEMIYEGINNFMNFLNDPSQGDKMSFSGYFTGGKNLNAYGGVAFTVERLGGGDFSMTMADTYDFNKGQDWDVPLKDIPMPESLAKICAGALCALPFGEGGPSVETMKHEGSNGAKSVLLKDDWMRGLPGSKAFDIQAKMNFNLVALDKDLQNTR